MLKCVNNDLNQIIEYEFLPLSSSIDDIEELISEVQASIEKIDEALERKINHADFIDYSIAAASGIMCGIIDSIFVGEFSILEANKWGDGKVKKFVLSVAQKKGYSGDDLAGGVEFLEKMAPIAGDKATNFFGGGYNHHLRDFTHHPTPVGLFFSFLTQFTGKVYGTDVTGTFASVALSGDDLTLIGKSFSEKIVLGITNWFFHMASDMAGSSGSIKEGRYGTGLPGPIVSLLKEASALPIFKAKNDKGNKKISVWISKLFNGTLLGSHDENGKIISPLKFDLRTEIGIAHELSKQIVPVLINECIVRAFYFIRRLINELSYKEDYEKINIKNVLPFNNRTISRMITIASGSFVIYDVGDAALRAAVASQGNNVTFFSQFLVRINFVGLGRFVIAIGKDLAMGFKTTTLENEKSSLKTKLLYYKEAKLYYRIGNTWGLVDETSKVLDNLERIILCAENFFMDSIESMNNDSIVINGNAEKFKENNKELVNDLLNILED